MGAELDLGDLDYFGVARQPASGVKPLFLQGSNVAVKTATYKAKGKWTIYRRGDDAQRLARRRPEKKGLCQPGGCLRRVHRNSELGNLNVAFGGDRWVNLGKRSDGEIRRG